MSSLLSVGEDPPNAFPVCLKQELFSGVLIVSLVHIWASISGEVSWRGLDYPSSDPRGPNSLSLCPTRVLSTAEKVSLGLKEAVISGTTSSREPQGGDCELLGTAQTPGN